MIDKFRTNDEAQSTDGGTADPSSPKPTAEEILAEVHKLGLLHATIENGCVVIRTPANKA